MKKTNFMTAVLLVVAVLLMAACTQTPITESPVPSSSSGGALEDNTLFGDDASSAPTQPTGSVTTPTGSVTTPSSSVTAPSTMATVPSTAAPTQPSTAAPTQPSTQATQPSSAPKDPIQMDYATFLAMTGAEQRAFQESFSSVEAFFAWYNAAKDAYEKANPPIEVGGNGTVDMGTLPTNPG